MITHGISPAPMPDPSARSGAPAGMRATEPTGTGRAHWHRRAGAIPLTYLSAIVIVGFIHPFLPNWSWLLIHLLLLGAATNAILIWSTHFTAAVLRAPAPAHRRAEVARLVVLNAGVGGVLVAGTAGPRWLGVASAVAIFGAVLAHLAALAARLRRALPARFSVTVRYYLIAAVALLLGIPVGAWMLVGGAAIRPRLLLFHAHVNVLGWISLTVLGTLLTLWPTVLRTRMADSAGRSATSALPLAGWGLAFLGAGLLFWWPVVAGAGLVLFGAAVVLTAVPAVTAARQRPPLSFAAWSIAAGIGWLLFALARDVWVLLTAADPAAAVDGFGGVMLPLLVGFVAQVLLGALAYLLPVALGGGPAAVRGRTAALERHWAQRVVMANGALVVFLAPVDPYVRITTSMLVLAALVQFLVPAVRILLAYRR